ncbi:hypothetical protein LR007_03035 [candidate division NPL-UPA2 bacterium]|nr:hypothetical protein [candidate division NPL-UPA2 bacterium]
MKTEGTSEIESEAADVMAWLASLANAAGVDLEQAVLKKYSSRCPKCRKERCGCP